MLGEPEAQREAPEPESIELVEAYIMSINQSVAKSIVKLKACTKVDKRVVLFAKTSLVAEINLRKRRSRR